MHIITSIRTITRPFTAVVCIVILTGLATAAPDTASIRADIVGMPLGTNIELRLKDQQKLRGARGTVSDTGFSLVDARAGERQIVFSDVTSVKQVNAKKSHTARNIAIGVGIGIAAAAITLILIVHAGGYI